MHRRDFIRTAAALLTSSMAAHAAACNAVRTAPLLLRKIPKTGEMIPAIGMGTWLTFNVFNDACHRALRKPVLEAFFAAGGHMIDSSPMYGGAEDIIGALLAESPQNRQQTFSATKV
jgi:aryl-alcohol dehydrogenase-like predicted oxidoreductase